ncbi:iron ABC transporter permease [Campylobacter jejuni]|uniref:Iron-uptake ABC transport system permease protein n=17 Tax=Campylobacter jejuni TaxID=197 RepID=Q0PBW5_CAMJE|nr:MULTISPECIES: iron ABC transporter permease [Campylobacter]YP_002343632.1 iron-uptake ABC transporter permease [Campylobacter jejuni subsp. jejuni NCTC 11168 = ATCC 700819]APA80473.1 Ferric iron ABC transporter, permease protein [Campylobacter jejuni subsp. jejuni D42a]EFV07113.1 binding-protein-dependent transport system inner membrane component family protein [Campylobacter jejuni subsp. jejuni DFVF1099]UBN62023.1 iron ABC transporter permease [Campylobacter coli]WPM68651.1 iron ABC trans
MYKTLKYYKLGAILLALFLALPIFGIFAELFYILFQNFNTSDLTQFSSIKENLSHFFDYLFLKFIKDTFIISMGVLCLSLILGVSSAYLIANYDFYFCKILEKLLILPLAIPAYILAFVYVGIMDFQGFFHENFGFRIDFFNHYGVIFVLAISLYPYIYLFAKTAFKSEAKEAYEVAKIMKYSEFRIFTRVALLSARPAIFSGALLVLMETLSDYGASAYLGVDTFSAGIFKLWYDLNDSYSSSVLSGILMLFVFLIMYVDYYYKNKHHYSFNQNLALFIKKRKLNPIKQILSCIYCFMIAFVGFILPFIWLVYWGLKDHKLFESQFYIISFQTIILALITALITTFLAYFLMFSSRIVKNHFFNLFILKISSLGYSIPAAALGISIIVLFVFLDKFFHMSLLGNSLLVLVFAYIIRFLASAIYSLEGGYNKIHLNIDEASLNLRTSYFILFFKIHTPLMKHFLFLAFIIVFIDTIKELPLSRILAPFGFETLSVKAFWFASDERIYDAALPSLFIVFLSLMVVVWMDKITRKDDVRN